MSDEFYYTDENGVKQDVALHAAILSTPKADRKMAIKAIERAVDRGMEREVAQRLFGLNNSDNNNG